MTQILLIIMKITNKELENEGGYYNNCKSQCWR